MKRIGILGHFGFSSDKSNGQTIKTKIVTAELIKAFGKEAISMEDTEGGWYFLLRLPLILFRLLRHNQHIIIMPAHKGVRVISPALVLGNIFWSRRLHYVVIGGWLPDFVKRYPILKASLKRFHMIYVETLRMKREMEELGFRNITVMPNCKPLQVLQESELPYLSTPPFHLCTFSRVIKQKGIADAIEAVRKCNMGHNSPLFTLDIYGGVEEKEWFDTLMQGQPEEIRYRGVVHYADSVNVLRDYFLLLFPTFYHGEGFAGTLLDALTAGVPVIATDWHDNGDLVTEGVTGALFQVHAIDTLAEKLQYYASHPKEVYEMKKNCLHRSKDYNPSEIIKILTKQLP